MSEQAEPTATPESPNAYRVAVPLGLAQLFQPTATIDVKPAEGVWMAFYGDGSSAVPFATEIEALRHALGYSMQVEFTKFGYAVGQPEREA